MNATQTPSQQLATLTSAQTTSALVESFCLTEGFNSEGMPLHAAQAVAVTRGAIMDELDRRDPEAFGTWLESDADAGALRAAFNVA